MTTPETKSTLDELLEEKKKIEDARIANFLAIEKAQQASKEEGIVQTKALIAKYGLTQADLFDSAEMETTAAVKSARKERDKSPVPKFLNPGTKDKWTGMGRNPGWMIKAIEDGKKQEDFLNPKWLELNGPIEDKKEPAKSVAPEQAAA
jgi:DNA-binding protein H-NS